MLKHLLIGAALAAPLAACQTTGQTAASVCANEPLAYAAWTILRPQETDPRVVRRVEDAHLIVRQFCAAPPADLASGLVLALQALIIIQQAAEEK